MKKIPLDSCRCFGQNFDSNEVCPKREECARYIDLQGEHLIEDVRIASTFQDREGKCGQRVSKGGTT